MKTKRTDEYRRDELERKYQDIKVSADDERKLRRECYAKYEEMKQRSKQAHEAFEKEKCQMEETIKKQKEEILNLQQAESRAKDMQRSRDDSRGKEQQTLEKYAALEKQHRTTREKLKETEKELDETKTK